MLRRRVGASILAAAMISACQSAPIIGPKSQPQLLLKSSDLTGIGGKNWAGTLTYLDYGSGEKVSLETNVNVTVKLDCLSLAISYPGEPEANATDEICISEDGTKFDGAPLISLQRLGPDFIAFQTQSEGEDDNKPALIRQNYILSTSALTSGKEVSFDEGETWTERNELDVERQ